MSGHLDRRLEVIARRLPPPRRQRHADWDLLSVEELEVAEAIAARYHPLPRLPDGTPDLSGVSDDDVATMADLAERVKTRQMNHQASSPKENES